MGVKLRAHDAELALQVIVIGVRQVVDRKDAQPIESQLGTFADAPKIGHIRDFPNGFGDIRITPFRNHIRLMLGGIIERQFGQERVIADADRCVDAGRLQYVRLDEFGHFVSRAFAEKFLGAGDVDETFVNRIDMVVGFIRVLLVNVVDFGIFLHIQPHLRRRNHQSRRIGEGQVPGPADVRDPVSLLGGRGGSQDQSAAALFRVG